MDLVLDVPPDPRPRSRMTARVRRDVLADRAAYRMVTTIATPRRDDAVVARVTAEVDEALELFERRGWLSDPASYHEVPSAPTGVRAKQTRSSPTHAISWLDQYECRSDEPGSARYATYSKNRVARATLLEHRSGDRPWLVCIHGFGMGTPRIDLRGFRAEHLYRDLGLNVAFLTLPFHGRRRNSRAPLPSFPGVDVMDNVHGLAQAVWDVRQLLQHLRAKTDQPIAVAGLSLGGLVAALTASLEDVRGVLLLVPVVDLSALVIDAAEQYSRLDDLEVAARAGRLLDTVSPLSFPPRAPADRSFIVAGTLDRFVRPSTQALALWRHWNEPKLHWYHGGHVSLFWSPRARAAMDTSVRTIFAPA